MVKIQTSKVNRRGKKITFPFLGTVKFDVNCQAEVSEEAIKEFEDLEDHSLEIVDISEEGKIRTSVDVGVDVTPVVSEQEVTLMQFKLEELKGICKDNEYSEDEWSKFKVKKEFVKYILGKLEA